MSDGETTDDAAELPCADAQTDLLSRAAPRLWGCLVVCGVAMAYGWMLGDRLGHAVGAAIPGALGGLALCLCSNDPGRHNRALSVALAAALGTGLAAAFSRAPFAGLNSTAPAGLAPRLFLAVAMGGVTGGLAGACTGMAVSDARYRWRDLLWLLALGAVVYALGRLSGADALELGVRPKTLAFALLLLVLWLRYWKVDVIATSFAAFGAAGLALGAALGAAVVLAGSRAALPLDAARLGAGVFGLCGGLAWGLAAYLIELEGRGPRRVKPSLGSDLALIAVAWLLPAWAGFEVLRGWSAGGPTGGNGWEWVYVFAAVAALVAATSYFMLAPPTLGERSRCAAIFLWLATSLFLAQVAAPNPGAVPWRAEASSQALLLILLAALYATTIRLLRPDRR